MPSFFRKIFRSYGLLVRESRFLKISLLIFSLIWSGALIIFFADGYYRSKGWAGLVDSLYWAMVTISTVGYGDIVPSSYISRIFTIIFILSGPILLSLITANIASIFVERKLKEGEGLEEIRERNHVLLCGWNENAERILEGMFEKMERGLVVLINELERDEVQSILFHFKEFGLKFVRGDFIKADVLLRANVKGAKAAVILSDKSSPRYHIDKADERTVFAVMAIKSLNSKVRTCAELINPENREHLLRAGADEVIVRGETTGSMIANAVAFAGLGEMMRILVNEEEGIRFWKIPVGSRYRGKSVGEVSQQLRGKYGALLIGIIQQVEYIRLEDILSEDMTAIDLFIKRKFEQSGKDFFSEKKRFKYIINPSDDLVLEENSFLVVISHKRPTEGKIMDRIAINP